MYEHMNNSIYFHLYIFTVSASSFFLIATRFDSIVNAYLIHHCALDPLSSECVGLVVQSQCNYFSPVAFPAVLDLGLQVIKLGYSSVTYEVGVFQQGKETVNAVGGYTHVFVEREKFRPAPNGIPKQARRGLQKLLQSKKPKL